MSPTRIIVEETDRLLRRLWPDATCDLTFTTPYELVVATVLSAQCTDARVNEVTPGVFERWPDPAALAAADQAEVSAVIRSTGFHRTKAKNLVAMAGEVTATHGGVIPSTMEELVALPGVGRKTANVVLGNAFGVPGLPVDTHVKRVSRRLGLTASEDPVVIERELGAGLDKRYWTGFSHRMIRHGRTVCHSRTAACGVCPFLPVCPAAGSAGPDTYSKAAALVRGDGVLERLDNGGTVAA